MLIVCGDVRVQQVDLLLVYVLVSLLEETAGSVDSVAHRCVQAEVVVGWAEFEAVLGGDGGH